MFLDLSLEVGVQTGNRIGAGVGYGLRGGDFLRAALFFRNGGVARGDDGFLPLDFGAQRSGMIERAAMRVAGDEGERADAGRNQDRRRRSADRRQELADERNAFDQRRRRQQSKARADQREADPTSDSLECEVAQGFKH